MVLAVLAVVAPALFSSADLGVGISTGEITVGTRLEPGAGYQLPGISVSNTGDVPSAYLLTVTYIDGQKQRRPSIDWFDFDPGKFALEPGESRQVSTAITVPRNAEPGEYFALLQAKTVSDQPGATNVGVAAATKLTFSVAASSWLDAQWRSFNRWLDGAAPWTYVVPAALLLAFLATKAHRLPFRLRIERK